jgi:hypothetical protein
MRGKEFMKHTIVFIFVLLIFQNLASAQLCVGNLAKPHLLRDSFLLKPAQQSIMFQKWDAEQLPFFCKWEHKLGAKLPIPVLFRLGSVEYVNWLEQKGGAAGQMPFRL